MPTQAKIDEVALLKEKLESAVSLVLADYRGLNANEMVELREGFTKEGLEYRVVKDTLARIAAAEAGLEGLSELLAGPVAIAFGYEDPAVAFKLSEACRKKYAPRYDLKGGLFEGVLVSESEVAKYATLPSREEILARLAMTLAGPMRALAMMLQAKIRELAIVLGEVAKAREGEPEPEPQAEADADAPTPDAETEPETQGDEAPPESADEDPEEQPDEGSQEAPETEEQEEEE